MYFSNFGYGGKRGKFGAELTWSDVQQFIQDFSKMGHPEATEHEAIIERKRWERNRQRMKEALAS